MAWKEQLVLAFLTWILEGTKGQDAQVTCVFSGRCILPCRMKPHVGEEVVHWYHTKKTDSPVHSYYQGEEQLAHQDPWYAGRTSLFPDQISNGNESLLLADVKIQDEGRYRCYTRTKEGIDETFINLKVKAPVKSVNIIVATDTLTCSSEGIYPAPVLVWSTVPPSDVQQEKAPEKPTNDQGLFSVTSTVLKSPNNTCICSVTAGDITQIASLRQQSIRAKEDENLVLPCNVPGANLKDFTLVWRFNGNSTVLTFDSSTSDPKVDKQWQDHVNYINQTAIELHNLNDTFNGQYSCEVFTTEIRHLEQTTVSGIAHSPDVIGLAVGIGIGVCILIISVIAACIWKSRKTKRSSPKPEESEEMPIKTYGETRGLTNGERQGLKTVEDEGELQIQEQGSSEKKEETDWENPEAHHLIDFKDSEDEGKFKSKATKTMVHPEQSNNRNW